MIVYYSGGSSYGARGWPEFILKRSNLMLTYEREREDAVPPNKSTRLKALAEERRANLLRRDRRGR